MRAFFKAHLGWSVFGLLVLAFVLYEAITSFVAYTWDGYVATDVVELAPEVEGRIARIAVRRDQAVKAGDLLYSLDPRPYEIAVAKAKAALALARAEQEAAGQKVAAAQAAVAAAEARRSDAALRQRRLSQLAVSGFISEQESDDTLRDLDTASAALASARAGEAAARSEVTVASAATGVAEASLQSAEYDLSRTEVRAPADGYVAPFVAKPGDYVKVGDTVVALVTNDGWRVVANLQEEYVAHLKPGQVVYVRLASDPWAIHVGTVRGVARGIARHQDPTNPLPYVGVDTDWVRLQRRFPVEIDLGDLPKRRRLFAGADASVLTFMGGPS